MSNVKEKIKAVTSMRLFLPIVCLIAVLLVNLITTPGFFKISINNGVLYGYVVDIVNRASELVILAVGMTLVTAASGGQDISVGADDCFNCCIAYTGFCCGTLGIRRILAGHVRCGSLRNKVLFYCNTFDAGFLCNMHYVIFKYGNKQTAVLVDQLCCVVLYFTVLI